MAEETTDCPCCGGRLSEGSAPDADGPQWAAYLAGHADGYQDAYREGWDDGWAEGWADAGGSR
jgi:hypothetical protein